MAHCYHCKKIPPEGPVEDLLAKAQADYAAGNYGDSALFFSGLAEKSPENPLPIARLASIAARQGFTEEASSFLAHLGTLCAQGDAIEFFLLPARAFFESGDPETAGLLASHVLEALPASLPAILFLAESLRARQRHEEAIQLLEGAAALPNAQKTGIHALLFESLDEIGDLAGATKARLRFADSPNDSMKAFFALAEHGADAHELAPLRQKLLLQTQRQAASLPGPGPIPNPSKSQGADGLCLAFWLHSACDPAQTEIAAALARHLPHGWARICFIAELSGESAGDDSFQLVFLLADATLGASPEMHEDAPIIEWLRRNHATALVDLQPEAQASRPLLAAAAPVAQKLAWGKPTLPIADWQGIDCGLFCPLPPIPFANAPKLPRLFCATALGKLDEAGWKTLLAVLKAAPQAGLVLPLGGLHDAAKAFARRRLEQAGIAPESLSFWAGGNREDLCWLLGGMAAALALPGFDESQLAAALWMGRPAFACKAGPVAGKWLAGSGFAGLCETPDALAERLLPILANPPAADPALRQKLVQAGSQDGKALAQRFMSAVDAALQGTRNAQ
jgi:hypothetical protein